MMVSEEEGNVTPTKKRKLHYEQKYLNLWEKDQKFSGWVTKSNKGDYYFYCKSCKCDLKCGGGKKVLEKHVESTKHKSNVKGAVHQPTITSMLPESASKSFTDKIKSGEIKMACFLAKNNLPFSLADDLKDLIQSVVPDSKLASELNFGRTKAHAIVTNVTGKVAEKQLINILQQNKFSLIVDESTDRSSTKHLALIVRTAVDLHVEDSFLGLIPVIDGTSTALHNACTKFFEEKNISYKENMVGFAADGTNSMFGQHHSLSTLFAKDIPNLFLVKCICHSFHLCASYACKKLPRGVEDFARDVYNYIQNSPKRIGDYKEFQCFVNVKPHKLLHPAQTRWLSLLQVVKRLIEQLPALKLYFQSAVLTDRLLAAQSILDKCMEPTTELYLEFLNFVLPYFNDLNKEMQSESPKLYLLYEKIFITYKTILECFLKPEYLELTEQEKTNIHDHDKAAALETKILNIDFENTENHLPLEDIYLGGNVAAFIIINRNSIQTNQIKQLKQKCLQFYIESLNQIKNRFPFEDEHRQRLKNLRFLNPDTLLNSNLKRSVPSIAHLGHMFPGLCPTNLTEIDRECRTLRNTNLPFQEGKLLKADEFWRHISKIRKGDSSQMFPLLTQFVQNLLTLPHSSANVESLDHRRRVACLSVFYRLHFGECAEVLHNLIPPSPFHHRTTRRGEGFHPYVV
ncbi:hypothetical protein evm_009295 [Chilo suppressalis]|nr:hypothetical protein evm_009295 [Chilo suppressalis]